MTRDKNGDSPGFMDVEALVAQSQGQSQNGNVAASAPSSDEGTAPGAVSRDAPARDDHRRAAAKASTDPRAGRAFKLAIATVVLVVLVVAGLLLLPTIVRQRAIATARDAGFAITIDGVGVGISGITLRGVDAKAVRAPGITATIKEVSISGFTGPREARVHGLDLQLKGEQTDLALDLAAIVADARARFAGAGAAPHHLSIIGARLSWESLKGERVGASDIGLELDSRGPGLEDFRGTVGRFEVKRPNATFGPWSSAFESTAAASRVRLMFDPPVGQDGPSALVVWQKAGLTEVTVKIPRSSFKNLGVPASEIGLPATDDTDIQLTMTGNLSQQAKSEVTFDASLWRLRPAGLSSPIDVHAEGTAKAASAAKPFELEKTTIAVGPFTAGVSGTVTPHAHGARLDATFKTLPLTCERLAQMHAKNTGGIAATLLALGQSTGALRVTGAVNASGIVQYDTAEPESAGITWLAKETCGVSIFGM